MDEYVEVYNASDITFAYLMKANLESVGIPAQVTNENLQGAYCLDGMVPGVSVPTSHVEQAKQIIKEIQQSSEDEQEQSLAQREKMNKEYVLSHLRQAQEALMGIIRDIESQPDYDYGEYIIDITHLYHHINTAWNAQNVDPERAETCNEKDFFKWRQFPQKDIYLSK